MRVQMWVAVFPFPLLIVGAKKLQGLLVVRVVLNVITWPADTCRTCVREMD